MIKPPKYLAAPGTAPLYGYSWIRAHWDAHISELWLVEGVFDAVSMIDAGVLAVASLGKDLTRSQVRSIASLGSDQVIIAYDPDATKAAADAGLFLREHLPETTQVSVVMMSGDMDPDELMRSKGPSALAGLRKSAREIKAGHDALSVRLAGLRRAH
jgi:DNA primase